MKLVSEVEVKFYCFLHEMLGVSGSPVVVNMCDAFTEQIRHHERQLEVLRARKDRWVTQSHQKQAALFCRGLMGSTMSVKKLTDGPYEISCGTGIGLGVVKMEPVHGSDLLTDATRRALLESLGPKGSSIESPSGDERESVGGQSPSPRPVVSLPRSLPVLPPMEEIVSLTLLGESFGPNDPPAVGRRMRTTVSDLDINLEMSSVEEQERRRSIRDFVRKNMPPLASWLKPEGPVDPTRKPRKGTSPNQRYTRSKYTKEFLDFVKRMALFLATKKTRVYCARIDPNTGQEYIRSPTSREFRINAMTIRMPKDRRCVGCRRFYKTRDPSCCKNLAFQLCNCSKTRSSHCLECRIIRWALEMRTEDGSLECFDHDGILRTVECSGTGCTIHCSPEELYILSIVMTEDDVRVESQLTKEARSRKRRKRKQTPSKSLLESPGPGPATPSLSLPHPCQWTSKAKKRVKVNHGI